MSEGPMELSFDKKKNMEERIKFVHDYAAWVIRGVNFRPHIVDLLKNKMAALLSDSPVAQFIQQFHELFCINHWLLRHPGSPGAGARRYCPGRH